MPKNISKIFSTNFMLFYKTSMSYFYSTLVQHHENVIILCFLYHETCVA